METSKSGSRVGHGETDESYKESLENHPQQCRCSGSPDGRNNLNWLANRSQWRAIGRFQAGDAQENLAAVLQGYLLRLRLSTKLRPATLEINTLHASAPASPAGPGVMTISGQPLSHQRQSSVCGTELPGALPTDALSITGSTAERESVNAGSSRNGIAPEWLAIRL
jgi:hypothetical protein